MAQTAPVRIRFGDAPPDWPKSLPWYGVFFAVIWPAFSLAAITGHPDPQAFLIIDFAQPLSLVTYGFWALQLFSYLAFTLLIFLQRPLGLFLLIVGVLYVGMALNALFIAAFVLGSWIVTLVTLLLVTWSVTALWRVNASITQNAVAQLAEDVLLRDEQAVLLVYGNPSAHRRLRDLLHGRRHPVATIAEFSGAFVVFLLGPGLIIPFAIVGDLSETGLVAWIIWLLNMLIFLAARGTINSWLLQLRATRLPAFDQITA